MPETKASRLIIDTNLWISFLIGKELHDLKDLISFGQVKLIISDQSIRELRLVTSRQRLLKYFDTQKVEELLTLIEFVSEKVKIKKIERICRDPKDDFLLAMAKDGKADYLLTGDKDLLEIGKHYRTEIISIRDFQKKFG
ncbi:MAG: putative toxin-antitoxin system toxin component, PIN family [Cyclobacteriaceae bacterium]